MQNSAMSPVLLSLVLAGAVAPAYAQETVDIGVIRDDDVAVVQKILYPKEGRTELGVHVGVMPFDAYLTTPNGQLSLALHQSESLAVSIVLGGGYGLKTATYRTLESPAFGVAPYAYRYLGSGLIGVEWSPIYAKLNLSGTRILHFDVYGAARAGVTAESSVIPDGGFFPGPTVSPGLGARVFLGGNKTLHLELRDDLVVEYRKLTQTVHLKQNANVTLGITFLSSED